MKKHSQTSFRDEAEVFTKLSFLYITIPHPLLLSKDAVSLFVKSPCSAKEKPALTEQQSKRKTPNSRWNQEFWSC